MAHSKTGEKYRTQLHETKSSLCAFSAQSSQCGLGRAPGTTGWEPTGPDAGRSAARAVGRPRAGAWPTPALQGWQGDGRRACSVTWSPEFSSQPPCFLAARPREPAGPVSRTVRSPGPHRVSCGGSQAESSELLQPLGGLTSRNSRGHLADDHPRPRISWLSPVPAQCLPVPFLPTTHTAQAAQPQPPADR